KVGATEFLGYETEKAEGVITAIVADGRDMPSASAGTDVMVVANQTPFYAESGGQVGDRGVIRAGGGKVEVTDTRKFVGDLFVHIGKVVEGQITTDEPVELEVDHTRRAATRANHSATHLVHEALRQVLGSHVAQRGSLVSPDRLRFDFSHTKPLDCAELDEVQARANRVVAENADVTTRLMDVDAAIETGAMALFGEKYGDEVRVVAMGAPADGETRPWSIELCGGTHVTRTGDIGLIHIVDETASASGIRRVEALTGDGARAYLAEQDARVKLIAVALKTRPDAVPERVATLLEERKSLEKQLADAKRQLALADTSAANGAADDGAEMVDINGFKFFGRAVQGLPPKDLRGLVDDGKRKVGSGVVAIIGVADDGKAGIAVGVTDDLTERVSAVDLVKVGAAELGGKGGGGRPDMAQAGGPDGAKAADALKAIEKQLG
ncbi:MAG: alanine--tRNA ligase-related protein, partial [Pseudomonadota bacterium]